MGALILALDQSGAFISPIIVTQNRFEFAAPAERDRIPENCRPLLQVDRVARAASSAAARATAGSAPAGSIVQGRETLMERSTEAPLAAQGAWARPQPAPTAALLPVPAASSRDRRS